ncbi:toxin VasX [Pseudomonas sp. NPDC086581]|uniref:toxin VasX n=1 Tax=Pseudomonas sp. NPDC086581 TaxID=3364432 RepID=UPI0038166039
MPQPAPTDLNVAACPLLTAILPLRYAIGPSEQTLDVSAYNLPTLQGSFPDLGPRLKPQVEEDRSLGYTARLLRDGWLYVWHKSALAEYRVERAQLSQTDRGGRAIDTRTKPYLICFAGHPASLVWSPIQWSDNQFRNSREKPEVRQRIMREITPGAAPYGGQVSGFKESIGDYREPEYYDWTDAEHYLPDWPRLLKNMRECEQQAYAIIDDPWGVQLDLAKLIRLSQQAFQDIRQVRGEDWHIAGLIRSLADNDAKTARDLPAMTDYPRLERTWAEQEQAEDRHEAALRHLSPLWVDWFTSLARQGPQCLDSACSHFDIVQEAARDDLQAHFATACLGPASTSLGLKAIVHELSREEEGREPWLLWAVLGVGRRLGIGEINNLLGLLDGAIGDGAELLADLQRWAVSLNQAADQVEARSSDRLGAAGQALLDALGTVFAVGAPRAGQTAGVETRAAQRYFSAAMARSGQRLAVASVSAQQYGEWLSHTLGTRIPGAKLHSPGRLGVNVPRPTSLPFVYPMAASVAKSLPPLAQPLAGNQPLSQLLNLDNLKSAQLKILLLATAGVNFSFVATEFFDAPSAKKFVGLPGSGLGVATATSAVFQKLAESDWEKITAASGKTSTPAQGALGKALGRGAATAALQAATSTFDVLLYGLEALEAYRSGDYASAGVRAGQSGASALLVRNSMQLFRELRVARAAALLGNLATLEAGLRVAPHLAAKGLGLTLMVVSGIFLDWYVQHTPLEAWLKQNRFGRNPADWAADGPATLDRLYSILFPITLSLHRLNETHPYSGDTISSVYLLLYSGGKFLPDDAQVEFSGVEGWEYLPGVSTLARPVIWTLSDFNAVINSGINWQHHKPLYRRVYHKEDDLTLAALKGVLHYSPQPGLVLPPVNVEERLWI